MNDTVYAVVQLNGSDNISSSWTSNTVDLGLNSSLNVREPYYKREGNYMYMYVGVGSGKAVNLRTKHSDKADLAYELHTSNSSHDTQVRIGPSSETDIEDGIVDNFIWVYPTGQADVSAGNRTLPSVSIHYNSIIGTMSVDKKRPSIQGFNILMHQNTTIRPASANSDGEYINNTVSLQGISVTQIPRLTLSNTIGRCYGTRLPATAQVGEVFFLISN